MSPVVRLSLLVFAFFAGLTVLSVAAGFAAERALPGRRIFTLRPAPGQVRRELVGNAIFVLVTTATFTVALSQGWVHLIEGSWLRGLGSFVALFFGFQIFYYALHRAMHTPLLLPIHRWHHVSQVTSALSAQSVSPGEALLWMVGYVGLPVLLSRITPLSPGGWAAYMAFNVMGNVGGHANVELTAKAGATRAATWFANPFVFHALHHARWIGHYGFGSAMMDRLFKSEHEDWPALYQRVTSGQPLTSFKERG